MKVTLATLKSFLKKNEGNLLFKEHSRFDGMQDMVVQNEQSAFKPLVGKFDPEDESSLGYQYQIWCVRGGRDRFTRMTSADGKYEGIHCYNDCGSWTVFRKIKSPQKS
jgi:hypothetical protein